MKKLLPKISFCSIIILSCLCFTYINTTDLKTVENENNYTETPIVNDKMIGSVKTATVMFAKALDLLASRERK